MMKIALVHDYLKEFGGAERVLEVMHEIWPKAPIFVAFVDWKGLGPHAERIKNWDIRTSWIENVWPVKKLHSPLRFLTPWVWKYFNFDGYDVVLTSSAWYIPRGIVTRGKTKHICYMHTPPRHLYGYETSTNWRKYLPIRVYGEIINHFLRLYDYQTAQKVDYFIANSEETKRRIEKFYRRDSIVIYPPVNSSGTNFSAKTARYPFAGTLANESAIDSLGMKFFSEINSPPRRTSELPAGDDYKQSSLTKLNSSQESKDGGSGLAQTTDSSKNLSPSESTGYQLPISDYYLCVGRLARAKHIDLAIKACNKLQKPLVVVGRGKEERYLRSIAGPTITFMGEVSDSKLAKIYKRAKALIFPAADEEFGIVPVEAMSYAVPVIAYRSGGVQETVIEGKTGFFFDELSVGSLIKAMKVFNNTRTIKSGDCIRQVQKFSKERFKREIQKFIAEKGV